MGLYNYKNSYKDIIFRIIRNRTRIRSECLKMLTIDWLFRARGKGGIPFLHVARESEDIQTERHKVLSLLAMIRPEAGLNAVKTVVRDNPRYNDSLRAAIDYLTTEAEAMSTRRSQVQRCRAVAALESGRGSDGGRGRERGR